MEHWAAILKPRLLINCGVYTQLYGSWCFAWETGNCRKQIKEGKSFCNWAEQPKGFSSVSHWGGEEKKCLLRSVTESKKYRPVCSIAQYVTYSLVQWNWFSDVTGRTWGTYTQWRQRTNFTAPGCTGYALCCVHTTLAKQYGHLDYA